MKVGDKVKLIPELGGLIGEVEAFYGADNVHVRTDKPIRHRNLKGDWWDSTINRFHSWQLRSLDEPDCSWLERVLLITYPEPKVCQRCGWPLDAEESMALSVCKQCFRKAFIEAAPCE